MKIHEIDQNDLMTSPAAVKTVKPIKPDKKVEFINIPNPPINTEFDIDYPLAFSDEDDGPAPDLDAIAERWAEDRGII